MASDKPLVGVGCPDRDPPGGSGSMVLPGGVINPSVPIRNMRMKFAVLIGLIQVGEVSNRDIVETVLNLVRDRTGDPRGWGPYPLCAPRGWGQDWGAVWLVDHWGSLHCVCL